MKRMMLFVLISFVFFINSASAQLWTSDFSGNVKRTFYNTNDSVYLTSNAIFTPTTTLRVYIVNDNNTWIDQTNLTDVRGNYSTMITNSSGAIDKKDIWDPTLTVGKFDVVIDLNSNGVYDSGTCGTNDCVYSLTDTGFQVLRTPKPVISAGYGSFNPINHNWAYDPTNPYNIMMNLKLTGDTEENVKINTIYLSAFGSGNDKSGIKVVRIINDDNNNGLYDLGDTLKAWGSFYNDDGIASLVFPSPMSLPANGSVSLLVVYSMDKSVKDGETYAANVINIDAIGETTAVSATVSNLPLSTVTKTIIASPYQTTTTSSVTTTTTTTTLSKDECTKKEDCKTDYCGGKKQYNYSCEYSEEEKKNICKTSTTDVGCCDNSDCGNGEECVNNECEKKPTMFTNETILIITVIVVAVISLLTAYFYLKTKRREKPEYEYREQRYS